MLLDTFVVAVHPLTDFFLISTPTDTSSSSGANVEEGPRSPQTADENSRGSLKGPDDPDAVEKTCISSQDEKGENIKYQ